MADDYFLYVLTVENTGHAKIGVAARYTTRATQIQANCPYQLVRSRVYQGKRGQCRSVERRAHEHFRRFHLHSEWFDLKDHQLAEIDLLAHEFSLTRLPVHEARVRLPGNQSIPKRRRELRERTKAATGPQLTKDS